MLTTLHTFWVWVTSTLVGKIVASGFISMIRRSPSVANPPDCSAINAIGLHSYNSLNFPVG